MLEIVAPRQDFKSRQPRSRGKDMRTNKQRPFTSVDWSANRTLALLPVFNDKYHEFCAEKRLVLDLRNWALVGERVLSCSLLLLLHARKVCQCIHAGRRSLAIHVGRRSHARIVRRPERLWSTCGTVDCSRAVCEMAVPWRGNVLVGKMDLRRRCDLLAQS